MLNTKEEILDFIGKNPLSFIATTDNGQPRVRGIMIYKTDDRGIIFTTGKNKDFYRQLLTNPNVELCFYAEGIQIRVTGTANEANDDLALKKEIVASRPFLQPWIEAAGYEVMGLFRVCKCKATVWSLDSPMARKRFTELF
ncbi:MAG TPA: pyridoxamine 5'-phosphate oxidase family protein [Bacteroidales bacterium]|mgnify:CR=1 FL=1|nr:pyridoxamine 5'-phosphate oxidase family protein [Bacteroidales bacterium]